MNALWRRLAWWFRRRAFEREMAEEIRLHLEQEVADRMAEGQPPAEARRTALRDFGRVAALQEDARAVRGAPRLEAWVRDFRFAVRGLIRTPGAVAVATITLMLSIGALTTVAAVIERLLIAPLPYPDPNRLVVAWERRTGTESFNVVSVPNFEAWQRRTRDFSDLAGLVPDRLDLQMGRPERVNGAAVSPAWFRILGVPPARGRGFTDDEAATGARVIVLSDGLWREQFGADPAVVGRTARFGDQTLSVIGVMPSGFEPPAFGWLGAEQRYWVPFAPNADNRRWGRFLLVLGRLRPGATVAHADAELKTVAAALAAEGALDRVWTAGVRGLPAEIAGDVRPVLIALGVAAAALILAAGANLATTLLARARRRREELAVRLALGGTRIRVAGQLLLEAAVIGVLAFPAGWALGFAAVAALAGAQVDLLPRSSALFVTLPVAGLVAAITAAVTLISGLVAATAVPAGATRPWLAVRGGSGGLRATKTLIITEVAAAVLLTVVASLAARSFLALRDARLGFTPERVTAFRISLPPSRYQPPAARAFFTGLAERLRPLPGVSRVGLIDYRPYHGGGQATQIGRFGEPIDPGTAPVVDIRVADSAYFETLGIGRRRPADPNLTDGVIVNRSLAQLLWPGIDPIGRRIQIANADSVTVAGVVEDVRLHGPRQPVRGTIYFPIERRPFSEMDVMVRTEGPAEGLPALVRGAVAAIDPTIAVYFIEPMERMVAAAVVTDRVASWTLTGFSAISLLLAAGGIAAVLLVELSRRRRELGVRMALGATAADIRRSMVGAGLRLVIPGLAIGGAAAAAVVPLIRDSVPGARLGDPAVYLGGGAILVVAVVLALMVPVRRATTLNPIDVLRGE